MDSLQYESLQTQPYLSSCNISTRQKKLLFKARTRMVWVGDNFGKKEELCSACSAEPNTQQHLTVCATIRNHLQSNNQNKSSNYEDIFGKNPEKMKNAINDFEKCLHMRDQLKHKNN